MLIRMAQYGTRHGHASGKAQALRSNPDVEFAGVFEPDPVARASAQRHSAYAGVHWYDSEDELLGDDRTIAIAIEGRNDKSLAMARAAIRAGKHLWYDKPAGDDWAAFQEVVAVAQARGLQVQMGYMFRYHEGFRRIAGWVHTGLLGDVFGARAHMSTSLTVPAREVIARHRGGIFYDLAGHVLDQIVWLLGRPHHVAGFFRNDGTPEVPRFSDNTLGVLEFERAMAFVDIAAMEAPPMARRFEVYGTRGSAIMEPFEPARAVRLCLQGPQDGYTAGEQMVPLKVQTRQGLYDRELVALLATLHGEQPPDRTLDHELLVQETLLRATGK
ncbi:MAG: Gfo/Idh/MocA family oxidoreductase [Chloroflexi bacterium]|nr:Gfo/Idh/MocA family oxidoreductase [Chloroflexota bacterium]